jgi:hypothetical protein
MLRTVIPAIRGYGRGIAEDIETYLAGNGAKIPLTSSFRNPFALGIFMSAERNRSKPEPPQFFSGWKDIAAYLGKGVRTVQRYEIELGLPVRRPAGKSRGSVVATRAELDAWVSASPIREAFHLTRMTAGLVTSTADEIRNGVLEMHNLRNQMVGLRIELRHSVQLLKEGILSLHGELNESQLEEDAAAKVKVLESRFRTKSILDMLAMDMKQRKVS